MLEHVSDERQSIGFQGPAPRLENLKTRPRARRFGLRSGTFERVERTTGRGGDRP